MNSRTIRFGGLLLPMGIAIVAADATEMGSRMRAFSSLKNQNTQSRQSRTDLRSFAVLTPPLPWKHGVIGRKAKDSRKGMKALV
jgi:hypothetical protein